MADKKTVTIDRETLSTLIDAGHDWLDELVEYVIPYLDDEFIEGKKQQESELREALEKAHDAL